MNNREARDIVKKALSDWRNSYKVTCDESRNAMLAGLKPGQPHPPKANIYGQQYQDKFAEDTRKYRTQALDCLQAYDKGLVDRMTEAPASEAVGAVQMLAISAGTVNKDDPHSREAFAERVGQVMNRYGSNCLVHESLRDMAASVGVYDFKPHPLAEKHQRCQDLSRSLEGAMDAFGAMRNDLTDGYYAMVTGMVDSALPD